MKILFKIAFRNVLQHKKQSILVGLTLVLAIMMISMISVAINGMEQQVYANYIKIQSGHVIGIWEDVKNMSTMSPERLLYLSNKQLREEDKHMNKKAARGFKEFVASRSNQVEAVFYQVRQLMEIQSATCKNNNCTIFSLSEAHAKWMLENESVPMEEGVLYSEEGVSISRESADRLAVKIGDEVDLQVKDVNGEEKHIKRKITGIFANKAQYENYYVFMPQELAYELVGYDKELFDMARIYLKDITQSKAFADELDNRLLEIGDSLRAEDYREASIFFTQFYGILKAFYKIFFGFILCVIAVGLSATIHMNLLTRREEFGTLRAIGYSKLRCYGVIFLELFILAAIGAAMALAFTIGFTTAFGKTGIYVGGGAVTYMLGGESFIPVIMWSDIGFCVGAIGVFALVATIIPSRKLLGQGLTDLLAKRQSKKKKFWKFSLKSIK